MAKEEARPKEERPERRGRIDTVKPPESLPDASPLERMTELTRRVVNVPKAEAVKPERPKRRHR